MVTIYAVDILCAQLTRELIVTAKFVLASLLTKRFVIEITFLSGRPSVRLSGRPSVTRVYCSA